MDSTVIYSLGLGMQVNIKRTDGRIHTAVVSGINWEGKSVTVEWFERNETKGKEVDLESLVALNPHVTTRNLVPNNGAMENVTNTNNVSNINNVANNQHTSNPRQTCGGDLRPPPAPAAGGKNQINSGNGIPGANNAGRIPRATRTTQLAPPSVKIPDSGVGNNDIDDQTMDISSSHINGTGGGTVTRADQSQLNNTAPASRRRSNVVKEVEKLKKNREERRMRQAELKNEKENLMNLDPGNPNWEFSNMIREYRNNLEFTPLRGGDAVDDHQITVCVRKRPMNKKGRCFELQWYSTT